MITDADRREVAELLNELQADYPDGNLQSKLIDLVDSNDYMLQILYNERILIDVTAESLGVSSEGTKTHWYKRFLRALFRAK